MHPVRGVGQALDAVEVGPALGPAASYLEEVSSSATARSRRAEASSEGATNTRTPSACICGYCPPASSAETAALTPRLRSMPAISSASVRLATTATDTVAPSTIATPLLLVLPLGCSWLHGRTLADPWHSWKTSAGTSRRSLRGFALQGPVWPIRRASMGRWGWKPSGSKPRCRRQASAVGLFRNAHPQGEVGAELPALPPRPASRPNSAPAWSALSAMLFRQHAAPAIVRTAVPGIAMACVPDPDGMINGPATEPLKV